MNLKASFKLIAKLSTAAVLIFLVRTYVFSVQRIEGKSMSPNLEEGKFIFVNKLSDNFEPGDIVVFQQPGKESRKLVKRVIAPPNARVYVKDFQVYVNDKPLNEKFELTANWDRDAFECRYSEEFATAQGEYFLMGDNRCLSSDSRNMGAIQKENILGRVFYVF